VSLSDAGVSMDEAPRSMLGRIWPRTPTGMLLGIGTLGVGLIAATMSFQRGRDDKKASQTLITPSAAVSLTVAVEPTAAPVVAKPPAAPAAAEPSPAKPSVDREAASKSDDSHKSHTHEPTAPSRSEKPREKTPPGTGRPKNVDFGI